MFQITYSKKAIKFLQKQDKTTQKDLFMQLKNFLLRVILKNYRIQKDFVFEQEISVYYLM